MYVYIYVYTHTHTHTHTHTQAKESKDASEEKLIVALRLANRLETKMLDVEREREDARAVENCYKLKLKRLFDQVRVEL